MKKLCSVTCVTKVHKFGADSRSLRLMLGLIIVWLKKVLVFNNLDYHMSDKQSEELIQRIGIYIIWISSRNVDVSDVGNISVFEDPRLMLGKP